MRTRVLGLGLLLLAACLPGTITHYAVTLTPLALCDISGRGDGGANQNCQPPVDGGTVELGSMSLDERENETRLYFKGATYIGKMDNVGHLVVDDVRDLVREQNGCLTRQEMHLDALHDDPGFGIRQELRGSYELKNTADGNPQQCGRNVPYGQMTRYRLDAVETSQP